MNNLQTHVRKHWQLAVLILIFLLAFQIRLATEDMKYIQAFDPFFMYRYTEYVAEQGVLPEWDELSYYPPGRPLNVPPLMFYVTGYLYKIFTLLVPMSLFTFTKYITAVYGALAVIPAYLIGRELSNKEAGLMAGLFVGLSPSILSRTMAGFYDTDTVVIFFSLLTMYLYARLIKKTTLKDLQAKKISAWREVALATLGTILFLLTWGPGVYIPIIAMASLFLYAVVLFFLGKKEDKKNIIREHLFERLPAPLLAFVVAVLLVEALGYRTIHQIFFLATFASDPARVLIVNISVAELQHVDIFGGNMRELFARISVSAVFALAGAVLLLKKDKLMGSLIVTWSVLSLFTVTQGIRFLLVFAPAAAVAAGIAFGEIYRDVGKMGRFALPIGLVFFIAVPLGLMNPLASIAVVTLLALAILFLKDEETKDDLAKSAAIGAIIVAVIIAFSQASQLAAATGDESIDANWEEALTWLRDNTAQDAVVGTWWDPGHQLTGFSGKRVIADGAHCDDTECSPGLNTRISDLGKIFATSDENVAVQTLTKYRGDASEMYWIVSDDLVGKFRWLQYFGTGCDGVGQFTPNGQSRCPLYSEVHLQRISYDPETLAPQTYHYEGDIRIVFNEENVPIVVLDRDGKPVTFARQIAHINGRPTAMSLSTSSNQTLQGVAWIHPDYAYLVYVPPQLEEAMFTRMFLYEDELESFELVFKNKAIKIYKLKL